MNIIEIKYFTKLYNRNILAVNNLNLNVKKGILFGFIGQNGAGKTTTVHFLAGLLKKTEGELHIFGERIDDNSYEYKRKVGFVLEKPLYFDKLTGEEYLHFVGQMYDLEKEFVKKRTSELFEFLEMTEKKNKRIETYSAGMKKKISFSAAIIHKPELLILDEPFEGIDPISSKIIQDNLKLMVQNGTTIFLTSHNLNLVEKLCTEVAIIHKGEIILQSTTKNIRNRIKNRMNNEKYSGLEELFLDLVSQEKETKYLSWLNKK